MFPERFVFFCDPKLLLPVFFYQGNGFIMSVFSGVRTTKLARRLQYE